MKCKRKILIWLPGKFMRCRYCGSVALVHRDKEHDGRVITRVYLSDSHLFCSMCLWMTHEEFQF